MEHTEEYISKVVSKFMLIMFIMIIILVVTFSLLLNMGQEDFWFAVMMDIWFDLAFWIIGFLLFYKPAHKWIKKMFMEVQERDKKAGKL